MQVFVAVAIALAVAVGYPARAAAQAQPQRTAAAEALFQQGRALLMAGKPDEACPKLEESQRLDPATGTLMALAFCREQQGKLASAWAAFADVEGRARLDGRADRERTAREHGEALRPRLSTLTLQIAPDAAATPGLAISVDGGAIGRGAWNVAIPVDGGAHVIDAAAPGKKSWRATIAVQPERDQVRVDIPALSPASIAPAAAVRTVAPEITGAPEAPRPATAGHGRTIGLALVAAGAVGLGVGTYLALDARRDYDAARAACQGTTCLAEPFARAEAARTQGNWATVISIAGGAAAATGVVLWLVSPVRSEQGAVADHARIDRVGLDPRGVVVAGHF
jgi:hypothetical protein